MGCIRVGISGWRYSGWRSQFYPQGLPQRRELEYASQRFATIELNGSFYSLQRPESFARWREETPDDFVFSVKGGRFITHMKRLTDAESALANFFASGLLALGPKLGPILWQLPPTLKFDAERLAAFAGSLPRTTEAAAALAAQHDDRMAGRALTVAEVDLPLRYAIEVRDPSYLDEAFVALMAAQGVAVTVADNDGRWPLIEHATTDFCYVRLHGDLELYASGYTDESLARWSEKIGSWGQDRDVFVYFDNDAKAHAPFDALRLVELLRQD
jgi:uncharacterized protein YecE (DUF72 family)